jgi:hypothetical protein
MLTKHSVSWKFTCVDMPPHVAFGFSLTAMVEAVDQVGGEVELSATDVDLALVCFAEGNYAWVKVAHQCTEREEVQCAIGKDVESIFHRDFFM